MNNLRKLILDSIGTVPPISDALKYMSYREKERHITYAFLQECIGTSVTDKHGNTVTMINTDSRGWVLALDHADYIKCSMSPTLIAVPDGVAIHKLSFNEWVEFARLNEQEHDIFMRELETVNQLLASEIARRRNIDYDAEWSALNEYLGSNEAWDDAHNSDNEKP